jgi:hypothetical protein
MQNWIMVNLTPDSRVARLGGVFEPADGLFQRSGKKV